MLDRSELVDGSLAGQRPGAGDCPIDAVQAGPLRLDKGSVIHSVRAPGSQQSIPVVHHIEIILAPVNELEFRVGSNAWQATDVPAGTLLACPAEAESSMRWSSEKESVIVALQPAILSELAAHEAPSLQELQWPILGPVDPFALRIGHTLKSELTREKPANPLYVDSLLTQLGVHLLRNYTNSLSATKVRSKLSSFNAKRIHAFMRENLARKLTLGELATVCELSPSHFANAFSATFGQSPYHYLINMRLAYAEKLLTEREMTIAQVAYLSGFSSQSHLTATMRKFRRATPLMIRAGK